MKVDLVLTCSTADVRPVSFKEIHVQVEDVDVTEILDYVPITEAIDHYGTDKLLDEIGIDRVKEYFNLQDKEDQP